jgi:hypothetical protein
MSGGRGLAAEEIRHQRLHARSGQQRGAVVGAWDQRRRRPKDVAFRLEESAETRTQLG